MIFKILFGLLRAVNSAPPNRRSKETWPSRSLQNPKPFDSERSRPSDKRSVKGRAWVIAGDTVVIDRLQIRLFGLDAPEINHPFGQKAKWALVRLCKGQALLAEVTDVDVHGRTVARCFRPDGRDLSAEMVKMGLAIDWPKYSGGAYPAMECAGVRRRLWLADARQKGRMHVWREFEPRQSGQSR